MDLMKHRAKDLVASASAVLKTLQIADDANARTTRALESFVAVIDSELR